MPTQVHLMKSSEPPKKHDYCHHNSPKQPRTFSAEEETDGVVYICPMHLESHQIGPGNCPICGMAQERCLSTKLSPQL